MKSTGYKLNTHKRESGVYVEYSGRDADSPPSPQNGNVGFMYDEDLDNLWIGGPIVIMN